MLKTRLQDSQDWRGCNTLPDGRLRSDRPCCPLPNSWLHSTPLGGEGQLGIATKSHEKSRKATKRAAPKTPLRGLCALCVKSSHAKLAKNAKKLEWPGRRRRVGVATKMGSARMDFRALLCFSWLGFSPSRREGVFPGLRPALITEKPPSPCAWMELKKPRREC